MISKFIYALFKTDGTLGVDIGDGYVKLSKVNASEHKFKAAECASLRFDIPENATPADRISITAEKMRQLIKAKGIGCRNAAILLSDRDARIVYSLLDRRPEDSFRDACRKEAERIFFNADDMLIDYDILGEVMEDGVPKVRVVFAGAKKETVSEKVIICEQAGLEPMIAIPSAFAYERMFRVINGKEDGNFIFVKLGRKKAGMFVFSNGRIDASRTVMSGSEQADRRIAETLDSSIDSAEDIKKNYPVPTTEEEKAAVLGRFRKEEAAAITAKKAYMESLAAEIDPFVYLSDIKISSVRVAGGPASDPGLCEYLKKHLKMPVSVFPSPDVVTKRSRRIMGGQLLSYVPSAAASISAAKIPDVTDINLLPSGHGGYGKGISIAAKTILYVALAAMAAAFFVMRGMEATLSTAIADKKASIAAAAVQEEAPALEALQKDSSEISAYISKGEKIKRERTLSEGLAKDISENLPQNVYLSSMVVNPEEDGFLDVEIKGSSPAEEALSKWAAEFKGKSGFENVVAGKPSKSGTSDNYYYVSVKFEYRGGKK